MTNEELKQEAREWSFRKKYAYGYAYTFEQVTNAYIEGAEPREKQIEQLEKENAELKESLRDNKKCHCMVYLNYKGLESNLTKAKDLLKTVLDWQCRCGNGHPTWQEVCAKIEQFLNSEVEK